MPPWHIFGTLQAYYLQHLTVHSIKTMSSLLTFLTKRKEFEHMDKFLGNSQKYCAVGQTLLIVWCALSVANLGRRICSVANILALRKESICFKSSGLGGCTYQIILKNRSVPSHYTKCYGAF